MRDRAIKGWTLLTGVIVAVGGAACSPAALTADEIVPAFIAASQDELRTMRMEWQGTLTVDRGDDPALNPIMLNQDITATFDFNGPDYAGTMTSNNEGGRQSISYAVVSGVSFVNFNDSGWQSNGSIGGLTSPEFDPLHDLAEADVAYEATDTFNGQDVHRLRVRDPLAALSGGLFDQSMLLGGQMTLEEPSDYLIYVNANGLPAGAKMALKLIIEMNMGLPEPDPAEPAQPGKDDALSTFTYQVDFTYTFSLWGEPVTISPPEVNGGGFDDFPPPPGIR